MISQPADAVPRSIARKPRGKIGFHSKIRTKGGDFMPSKKVAKKFLAKWGSDYQHPGEKIVTIRFLPKIKGTTSMISRKLKPSGSAEFTKLRTGQVTL